MARDVRSDWHPEWTVPPGEILLEVLDERAMTQSELARRTARPIKTINEIVRGKAAITPETAIQFERVLGISASFWNGAQAAHRYQLALQAERRLLEQYEHWLEGFPISELEKRDLIPKHKVKSETLSSLLSFFRVSSPDAWNRYWLNPAASYRNSATFLSSPKAISAWLRWGELEAAKWEVPEFDKSLFRCALQSIRLLTRRGPFSRIFRKVQDACSESGVILLLTPELGKTRISGAARWIRGHPVIQLSARHKSDDQFWFTFFHESGHILHPSSRRDYIDDIEMEIIGDAPDDEAIANCIAREILIPGEAYEDFLSNGSFTSGSICRFADRLNIAPGIIVGRLQHDSIIEQSSMNHLKRSIHLLDK